MQVPFELRIFKIAFVDIIYDMVRWPVWWYTRGFWEMLKWAGLGMKREWWNLALGPWLRSMFTPMYGDYSIAGRAISFVARIFVLCYRIVAFTVWGIWYMSLIAPYLLLPAVPVYLLIQFFRTT